MGEVVIAEHRELGRTFAVKLLLKEYADDTRLVDRLRIEARILAALDHENVVKVFGFDLTPEGRPYVVMEHLRGCSLDERLRAQGNLDVYEAVRVIGQLLAGLEAAHQKGVVHRDVKPTNIFLAETFGSTKVKLIDFGIGKVLVDEHVPKPQYPTADGMMVGTPRFSAPEQIRAQPVDARTDLYAAGLVAYTLLAGRGPFDHLVDTKTLLRAHLGETPVPPSTFSPTPLPSELDALVLRALEKQPDARFGSASEMREAMVGVSKLLRLPVGFAETTAWDPRELRAPRSVLPSEAEAVVVSVQHRARELPGFQLAPTAPDQPLAIEPIQPTLPSADPDRRGPSAAPGASGFWRGVIAAALLIGVLFAVWWMAVR